MTGRTGHLRITPPNMGFNNLNPPPIEETTRAPPGYDRGVSQVCSCGAKQPLSSMLKNTLILTLPAGAPDLAGLMRMFFMGPRKAFGCLTSAARDHAARSRKRAPRLDFKMQALAAAHEGMTQPRRAGGVLTEFGERRQPTVRSAARSASCCQSAQRGPARPCCRTGRCTPRCYSLRRPLWHPQVPPTVTGGCTAAAPSSLRARC